MTTPAPMSDDQAVSLLALLRIYFDAYVVAGSPPPAEMTCAALAGDLFESLPASRSMGRVKLDYAALRAHDEAVASSCAAGGAC